VIFHFSVESHFDLDIDEIWPDGDAPENPTVDDVAAVCEKYAPISRWMSDWDLAPFRVFLDGPGKSIEVFSKEHA
jgi:hypothetical protein